MKTMHLFAGAGGGLLADLILGHEPVVAVEWDGYACQVLRERAADGWFPNLRVWEGDVRLFNPSEYAGKVDCIHAGFPCQDISVAGKQAGVSEGTRSGLYREVLRIADTVRPKYLFLENVAAILSNGLGTVLGDLAAMGYDARWCCIRASDVGAPHHRDRWWCRAVRNPERSGRNRNNWRRSRQEFEDGCEDVSNSISNGLQGVWEIWRLEGSSGLCGGTRSNKKQNLRQESERWSTEPNLGRVANGVAYRVDRLKALGNGQVPLQAAVAWKLLGGE